MRIAPGPDLGGVRRCHCGEELTHITRCEQDGHGSHHAHCCPSPQPASPLTTGQLDMLLED